MRLEPLRNVATKQVLIHTEHDGVTTGGTNGRYFASAVQQLQTIRQASQHDSPSLVVPASMRVAVEHDIRFLS
jgi:hypothetical protein